MIMQIDADKAIELLRDKYYREVGNYKQKPSDLVYGKLDGIEEAINVIMKMAREQYEH